MCYGTIDKYFNAMYVINNPQRRRLSLGDRVIVHPTKKSMSRDSYTAFITVEEISWVTGKQIEICTRVLWKHRAVMNDYLFNRLEPVK